MRRVNWTFALCLLFAGVAVAGGFHALHVVRYGHIADDLRWQVERSRDDGRTDDAIRYAAQYLEFRPNDVGMMTDLADWLRARSPNRKQLASILGLYERIARLNPDDRAARRKVVELSMAVGNWATAIDNLDFLLRTEKSDGELCEDYGYCQQCIGRYDAAAEWYRKAFQADPKRVIAYVRLAVLYQQQLKQPERVIPVIDEAIAANPNSGPAYVAKAQLLRSHGQLKPAAEAIRKSREFAPDDAQGLLVAADIEQSLGNYKVARELLDQGCKKYPKNSQFICGLAWQQVYDGRTDQAIATLREAKVANPKDIDVLTLLGDLLAQDGQIGPLESALKELTELNAPPDKVQYVQARLLMRRGRWAEAVALLDRLRMASLRTPSLYRHANLLLTQCYEQLGDTPSALDTYRRLLDHDPNAGTIRLDCSRMLARNGQYDESLGQYLSAVGRPEVASRAVAETTRALIDLMRRDAKAWTKFEKSVDGLKAESANVNPIIARAYLDLARNRPGESLAVVDKAVRTPSRSVALHVTRALLIEQVFGLDRALGALADAEAIVGDQPDLRIARARMLSARMDPSFAESLAVLSVGVERFNGDDRARVVRELVAGHRLLGDSAAVGVRLEMLSQVRPDWLWVRESLFARALRANDDARMQAIVSEIESIEGASGASSRLLEAQKLLWTARPNDEAVLAQAMAHLSAADRDRPKDPVIELLRGRVDEFAGRSAEALRHYRAAFELGLADRPVEEVLSMVRGKSGDAPVAVLRDQLPLADRLLPNRHRTLILEVASLYDAKALPEFARHLVANSSPADHVQQIWLGRLFTRLKIDSLAEEAFRRATAAAPQSPDGWLALAALHAMRGNPAAVDAVANEIRDKLPPIEAHMIIGRAFESVGQIETARREYESAAVLKPDDTRPLRLLVNLDLGLGRADEARKRLEQLVMIESPTIKEDLIWARRTLAVHLATIASGDAIPRALTLIDANKVNAQLRDVDARAKASILAALKAQQVPGKDTTGRREAIRILEELGQKNLRLPGDLLQLARLYRAEGVETKSRTVREQMRAEFPTHVGCCAFLAREALRERDWTTCAQLIEKLRKSAPGEFDSVALDFQYLAMTGGVDRARRLLDECIAAAPTDEQRLTRSIRCANLVFDVLHAYPSLDRTSATELRAFAVRLFGTQVERDPQAFQRVVTLLVQQSGGTNPALRLIEQGKRAYGVEVAASAYVLVLRHGQPDPAQRGAIKRFLQDAIQNAPASTPLRLTWAEYLQLSGENGQAIDSYRLVLQREPDNVLALNNLAWNLSLDRKDQAKVSESLALIHRAIGVAGPLDELLDTRARILFESGQREAGLSDMCEAVNDSMSPERWRDYANMLERAGKAAEARQALAHAQRFGPATPPR